MFDLDKCRKQGWKVLVHTSDGWRVGRLCFLANGETSSTEFFSEMHLPDIINLPDGPTEQPKEKKA